MLGDFWTPFTGQVSEVGGALAGGHGGASRRLRVLGRAGPGPAVGRGFGHRPLRCWLSGLALPDVAPRCPAGVPVTQVIDRLNELVGDQLIGKVRRWRGLVGGGADQSCRGYA